MVSSPNLCILCKGSRGLCGNSLCPLLKKVKVATHLSSKISKDFFGPSPTIFVGYNGYPNVFAGPMGLIEQKHDASSIDNPHAWFGQSYSNIIEMRSMLLRSKYVVN